MEQDKKYKKDFELLDESITNEINQLCDEYEYSDEEKEVVNALLTYMKSRFAIIDRKISMLSRSLAYEKDLGTPAYRELPEHEVFTMVYSDGSTQEHTRESALEFIRGYVSANKSKQIPIVDDVLLPLFHQLPSFHKVIRSSGIYTVELVAMILSPNFYKNGKDLICLFATENHDMFVAKFIKNRKLDMYTTTQSSTFEIKQLSNLGRFFHLTVKPNHQSGLLRITDMVLSECEDEHETYTSI